jgi:hypothetical protein
MVAAGGLGCLRTSSSMQSESVDEECRVSGFTSKEGHAPTCSSLSPSLLAGARTHRESCWTGRSMDVTRNWPGLTSYCIFMGNILGGRCWLYGGS